MAHNIFRIDQPDQYQRAGASDLIELLPVPLGNPLYLPKSILESLVAGIIRHEFIHLSGPTGSAKTSLLEALAGVPQNFETICSGLGQPVKRLQLHAIEMAVYETPGELYQRRSLRDGTTFDEMSGLVEALIAANGQKEDTYVLVWLREMGRVHSSSVQGGLLNLMTHSEIVLPDGQTLSGRGIAWVADSNYQAEQDSTHTLVTLDDALKRRFSINLTLDYLPAELEVLVLNDLLGKINKAEKELVTKIVHLGQTIRRYRADGSLLSIVPPSIYGYLAFFRMRKVLPHLGEEDIALATLLGNANSEDRKLIPGVFNEVFGLRISEDDLAMNANLF